MHRPSSPRPLRARLSSLALVSFTAAASACAKEPPKGSPVAPASVAPGASVEPATAASVAPTPDGQIVVGKPAPAFSVKAADGAALDTTALKGRYVIVYFYPKDETPGCTKEACGFRDMWSDFEKTSIVLMGVSSDSEESHRQFADHHKLPFHLVSDSDRSLAKAFGVPPFGRQSFVIAPDGNVKKIYRTVNVTEHARELVADIQ